MKTMSVRTTWPHLKYVDHKSYAHHVVFCYVRGLKQSIPDEITNIILAFYFQVIAQPDAPIGGILTKYKQSNLLFKVRKSYVGGRTGSPRGSPHSPSRAASFEDIAENDVEDHTNDANTPIDYNVYNIPVQAPPSPREERRQSEMHDFTLKPRAKDIVLSQHGKRVSGQDAELRVKYKTMPIHCCCNACEIKLELFFKIQSLLSALTFWLFWGVASISEKAEYDTITELVFVLLCCWWNPMFYSTTIRASTSIRKYIMTSYFIVGAIAGVCQCILFIMYWYIKLTYGNGTDGWVVSDGGAVLHEQNMRFASLFLAFVVCFIFYFPATGYLFYRSESQLSFGLSHFFFATMAVFIPLAITDIADRNIFHIGGIEFGVKLYNITDEFHRDIHNKTMAVVILYMVVLA
eukprot:139815_1